MKIGYTLNVKAVKGWQQNIFLWYKPQHRQKWQKNGESSSKSRLTLTQLSEERRGTLTRLRWLVAPAPSSLATQQTLQTASLVLLNARDGLPSLRVKSPDFSRKIPTYCDGFASLRENKLINLPCFEEARVRLKLLHIIDSTAFLHDCTTCTTYILNFMFCNEKCNKEPAKWRMNASNDKFKLIRRCRSVLLHFMAAWMQV